MTVFSKLSCHQIAHPRTASCRTETLELIKSSYVAALKIYLVFYSVSALVKRNRLKYLKERFLRDLLRSVNFLAISGWLFSSALCMFRGALGKMYPATLGFAPGFVASLVGILMESRSRRRVLAVYITTVAIESVYRALRARNLLPLVRNANVILFAIASALLVRLLKKAPPDQQRDFLQAVRFVVGCDEGPHNAASDNKRKQANFLDRFDNLSIWSATAKKTEVCKHGEQACLWYALKGALRMVFYGAGIQLALNLLSLRRLRKFNISSVSQRVSNGLSALPCFLGGYAFVVRSTCCLLRHVTHRDDPWHGLLGGLLASPLLKLYDSMDLPVFLLSRIADFYYEIGMQAGLMPRIPFGVELLFALSTAVVTHIIMFEPQNVKASYYNSLLVPLSGGALNQVNRRLLTEVSSQCTVYKPDYWPKYDPTCLPTYMLTDRALTVLGLQK